MENRLAALGAVDLDAELAAIAALGSTMFEHESKTPARRSVRPGLPGRRWFPVWLSRSKYMPHQGKQECARRVRQREKIAAKQRAIDAAVYRGGLLMTGRTIPLGKVRLFTTARQVEAAFNR